MRIGLCVKSIDGSGGIQKNYKLWFNMFKKRGIEVLLYVLEQPKYETLEKDIIVIKGNSLKEKGRNLEVELKKYKFDLLVINTEYLKKYIPQKYFISVHNTWEIKGNFFKRFKRFRKLKQKYLNENLIGISKSVLDNITDNLKIEVKSKNVIYAPHDFELVRNLAQEKNIEDDFIVSVGGLNSRKNYSLLIESFFLIKDKTKLNLYIIGDGKEKKNLESLIEKLNLKDRVKLLGFQKNPYPYIKKAKLLVSSSISEGLQRTIVEAFILNTPVVTTYSSKGVDEVMIDNLKEFIVYDYNKESLSKTILKALKQYPTIDKKYYSKFSEEESFKNFIKLIEKK